MQLAIRGWTRRVNYQRFLIAPVAAPDRTFVFEDPSRIQSYFALRSSFPRGLPLFLLLLCDRHAQARSNKRYISSIKLKRNLRNSFQNKLFPFFLFCWRLSANKLNSQQILWWINYLYRICVQIYGKIRTNFRNSWYHSYRRFIIIKICRFYELWIEKSHIDSTCLITKLVQCYKQLRKYVTDT